MKFDVCIMNPPYEGTLYYTILEQVLPYCKNTVCICPNWLYLYKKKWNIIPNKIVDFTYEESSKIFENIQLPYPLAISIFDDSTNKIDIEKYVNPIYKILKNKKFDKSLADVNELNYNEKGYFVPLKLMTSTWDKNKNFIADKLGVLYNGRTISGNYYKDDRKKNKDRPCGGVHFKTKNEAENFYNSLNTLFYQAWVNAFHTGTRYILSEYPFMSDYTQPWTDERFYKYFDLTKEEIKIIEDTMKE